MSVDTSVVIGFRNWGADRIRLAGSSILAGFDERCTGELIISDYGSDDAAPARAVAEELGAIYVYTAGDPDWSRSRALNAGFRRASGRVLISTDADMLFSPTSMRRITERAIDDPRSALFLQCRDLPTGMDSEAVAEMGMDWDEFEHVGRLRPRWGMGGMMAVSREGYEAVGGFDDRLHTYGGEDLDFAQRLRRAGFRTVWVDDPEVRMYHMWHPSSRAAAESTPAGKAAVEFNRSVVYDDTSFVRNVTAPPAPGSDPLVTVSIVTHNRSGLLAEAISSVLAQTVRDLEVVVVDDGSTDDTRAVVEGFTDPRVRYVWQEQAGIAAARNRATAESRGRYTAVADDDDLMPAERLEWQLAALDGGAAGTVGSFVNFDDRTGELDPIVSQVPTIAAAEEKGGAPGHGTWLVRTDILREFGYDESLTSGVDNNLMLRMLRAGLRFNHTGKAILLRRTHDLQVTVTDGVAQDTTARRAHDFFTFSMTGWSRKKFAEIREAGTYPKDVDRQDLIAAVRPYLPDHLVQRDVRVEGVPATDLTALGVVGAVEGIRSLRDGSVHRDFATIAGATLRDLATLRSAGIDWTIESVRAPGDASTSANRDPEGWLMGEIADLLDPAESEATFVVVTTPSHPDEPTASITRDVELVAHRGPARSWRLLGFSGPTLASAALMRAKAGAFLVGPFVMGADA